MLGKETMGFTKYEKKGRAFRTVAYRGFHIGENIVNLTGQLFKEVIKVAARVDFYYDAKAKIIKLHVNQNGSFKLGMTMGVKLSEVMPKGRYIFDKRDGQEFIFTSPN